MDDFHGIGIADFRGPRPAAPSPDLASIAIPKTAQALIVDDNSVIRALVGRGILKQFPGVSVEFAQNGAEAIERCRQKKFDVITMDFEMPVKTGLETAEEILGGPLNHDTPIIGFSDVTDERVSNALEIGMRSVIYKTTESVSRLLREIGIQCPHIPSRSTTPPPPKAKDDKKPEDKPKSFCPPSCCSFQ